MMVGDGVKLYRFMKIKRLSRQVLEVRLKYVTGQSFEFLLCSDVHYDNPKCDRNLFKDHLDQAQKKNARVMHFGDFFCMMQGNKDRRGSKADILPQHKTATYFDDVIYEALEDLTPYKDDIILMGNGNHETAIIRHNEIDPLGRLTKYLRREGSQVEHMPYQSFTKFVFEHESGGRVRTIWLAAHHGKFGGSVTKGTIGTQRYSVIYPQADIIVSGHNHNRFVNTNTQYIATHTGKVKLRTVYHFNCATYKNEFSSGDGFGVEKIVVPKPMGGWWLKLTPLNERIKIDSSVAD